MIQGYYKHTVLMSVVGLPLAETVRTFLTRTMIRHRNVEAAPAGS